MAKCETEVSTDIMMWPTLTNSILENSELDSVMFVQDEETLKRIDASSPVRVEAIKEDDLEALISLNVSGLQAETYQKFTDFIQKFKDDRFYSRVAEYKRLVFAGQLLTLKLEISKDSSRDIAEKCWTLVSKQAQFDQECGDGRLLHCFTSIDSAVFNQNKANEFLMVNNQVIEISTELMLNDYFLNVSKLYIQNYLDLFLKQFFALLSSFSSIRERMEGWEQFQIISIITRLN